MARSAPARFGAVITAMVTPFDSEGRLDVDGAVALARWLGDHGSDGLVIAGTTGEASVLRDSERMELFAAVASAVTIPVLAGTGTADTAHSIELTQEAERAGVDGILLVTPYYNRPPQAGLVQHFTAVASATRLPVILYDIPVRTGRKIAHETLVHLARSVSNIVGVKDAAGDVPASARLVAELPDGFELYSGDDKLTLPLLAVGAVGVVSVASHWAGLELREMVSAFLDGRYDSARSINARLTEVVGFQSSDAYPNPLPAKAACRALGLPVGQCRLPMGPAPSELDDQARKMLAGLARLEIAAPSGDSAAGAAHGDWSP